MTPTSVDPLTNLTTARLATEGASDFWALILQISTVAILVGVFVEVVATVLEIFEDRREGKKLPFHAVMTLAGGALVAVALGFEFFAEYKASAAETELRKNNATTQGELDKRARDATAEAVRIADKFGGLKALVDAKGAEMDAAVTRLAKRTDSTVSKLASQETSLQKAQNDVIGSASKAANAADVANKTAQSMTETLNSEKQMNSQMRALVTPRTIDEAHFAALINAIKPFPKTPIDLAVTRDPECGDLLTRISDALVAAKWDIRPWQGAGFALVDNARPDLPAVGEITGRGLQISVSESDRAKFETPGNTLINALVDAGLPPAVVVIADKLPDGKPNPLAAKQGAIHLMVGTRQ